MRGGRGRAARPWRVAWDLGHRHAPRSPVVAVAVLVGLMAAVTVLRWFVDGAGQAAALLYVVPIALSALRFGRRGGAGAAGCGIAAFVVLELVRARGDADVTGWVGPLLAMALMGGLVGHLSESAARHEAARRIQQRHLDELRRARRAALEAGDSIVQRVAAVRWMLEAGKSEDALAALEATVAEGIAEVSSALPPPSSQATGDGHPVGPPGAGPAWDLGGQADPEH